MSTIEVFKPVVACTDAELHDGAIQGLWLIRGLFVALGKLGNQQDEGALSFLGEAITTAVEHKHEELSVRHAAGGAP